MQITYHKSINAREDELTEEQKDSISRRVRQVCEEADSLIDAAVAEVAEKLPAEALAPGKMQYHEFRRK